MYKLAVLDLGVEPGGFLGPHQVLVGVLRHVVVSQVTGVHLAVMYF